METSDTSEPLEMYAVPDESGNLWDQDGINTTGGVIQLAIGAVSFGGAIAAGAAIAMGSALDSAAIGAALAFSYVPLSCGASDMDKAVEEAGKAGARLFSNTLVAGAALIPSFWALSGEGSIKKALGAAGLALTATAATRAVRAYYQTRSVLRGIDLVV
jgi:hypothetical protein